MEFKVYEKIIKEGERVEWYGTEVPQKLITASVRLAAENLAHEIDKLESEIGEEKTPKTQSKRGYIEVLKSNLKNLPYTFNGDVLLRKKQKIEEQMKPKVEKKSKTKSRTTKKSSSTKNSDLIFGKK